MRKRLLFGALGLLALAVLGGLYRMVQSYPCETCVASAKERYQREIAAVSSYSKTSDQQAYRADCARENRRHLQFPLRKPASVQLHSDKLGVPTLTLTARQMEQVLAALNDTASYQWGELGTPYFDYYLTFHDQAGACIGFTELSRDGQTYSTPSLARMKWGLLTDAGYRRLFSSLPPDN